MSKLNERKFITISFSLLSVISSALLSTNSLLIVSDIILTCILLLTSILILTSRNNNINDFAHFLFVANIYLVSIFSSNAYLLVLNVLIFIVIILSRQYYKHCVLHNKHTGIGPFERFNKNINTEGTTEQGNILFGGTILFLLLKLCVI